MEQFFWQVHFRNWYILRRDWQSVPVSGTIRMGWSRRFFLEDSRSSRVVRGFRVDDAFRGFEYALGESNAVLAASGAVQFALPDCACRS
jgi:hypothetical protein